MKVIPLLSRPTRFRHHDGMIDCRQIRAARALLNWSQVDLARAAGMATSSIKNIEGGAASPRPETLEHITQALACNGVDFTPGSGVRLKSDLVSVHDGREATRALLDSIWTTAPSSEDKEVCIIGLDEGFSTETDGEVLIRQHIDRLTRAGVRERILIREGDTRFLNTPESYRWLPEPYFVRSAPIYIYGDRVAIHSGSLRRRTVILELKPLAQHLKRIFALLWDEVAFAPRVMHEERKIGGR